MTLEAKFFYNDENGAEFTISYLKKKDREAISKKALKKKKQWENKSGGMDLDIDMHLINKEIILQSITGWENVTNKTLSEILDPETFGENWNYAGICESGKADANYPIEYNKENLKMLSDNYSENFKSFSNFALDTLAEQLKDKNAALLKNF